MARVRLLLLALLLVWGLLSGSALMAIFPGQFQLVEEHEEKPHRTPSASIVIAHLPRTPRVGVEPDGSWRLERTCRRAATSAARLARDVRAERVAPLRL